MEITNLTEQTTVIINPKPKINYPLIVIIIAFGLTIGFWLSRFSRPNTGGNSASLSNGNGSVIPAENVKTQEDLKVGKVYGNLNKNFSDTASGIIEKGSINGEGTHILNRDGGQSQRASLTSSVLDLDLFVGRQVEVKGETNSSNKTAWLMDVGTIKILE